MVKNAVSQRSKQAKMFSIRQSYRFSLPIFHPQGPTHIKRATTEKLRDVFQKYATQHIHGEQFMTSDDFVRGYLGLFPDASYNKVNK